MVLAEPAHRLPQLTFGNPAEDLGGFALGWVIVVVLVAATALLLRMT